MRVALVHYTAAPVVGGVEKVISAHAKLFRRGGHQVSLICRKGEADIILREDDPYPELKAAVARCDIVIVHNALTMPFDLPMVEALWRLSEEHPKKRWIAWVHDIAACNPHYTHEWHLPPWNRLTQAAPHFAYVAISGVRSREFEALTGSRAEVIPNGLFPAEVLGLTPAVAAFAAAHRLYERDLLLFHPTRLLRRKNVELGLRTLAELRRRGRDASLLVTALPDPHNAASSEYEKTLRGLRTGLKLESAALFVADEFVPQLTDLASLYTLSDALFFPSTQEGFGLPIIEAALHRLPVFCTDVEPVNVLLEHAVNCFDQDASPADIATLIETAMDASPQNRARRTVLDEFGWDIVWEQHLAPLLHRQR